jgi:hypothetical protein
VPIAEMVNIDQTVELHNNLVRNYGLRNWNYCVDAIEHLRGRWNGELDSFYDSIIERVDTLRESNLGDDWNSTIVRA